MFLFFVSIIKFGQISEFKKTAKLVYIYLKIFLLARYYQTESIYDLYFLFLQILFKYFT